MIAVDRIAIQLLRDRGRFTENDLTKATRHSDAEQITLGDALVDLGFIGSDEFSIARARVRECAFVDLEQFEINTANAARLPFEIADRFNAFPLFILDGVATVGMTEPSDPAAYDALRRALLLEIDAVLCEPSKLRALIARAYGRDQIQPSAGSRAKRSA